MSKLEEAKLSLEVFQGNLEDSVQAKAVKTTTKVHEKFMEALTSVMNQIFLLYSDLLSEEAKQPWNRIPAEQVYCSPWMDLQ